MLFNSFHKTINRCQLQAKGLSEISTHLVFSMNATETASSALLLLARQYFHWHSFLIIVSNTWNIDQSGDRARDLDRSLIGSPDFWDRVPSVTSHPPSHIPSYHFSHQPAISEPSAIISSHISPSNYGPQLWYINNGMMSTPTKQKQPGRRRKRTNSPICTYAIRNL
jgi:hypothetical protein